MLADKAGLLTHQLVAETHVSRRPSRQGRTPQSYPGLGQDNAPSLRRRATPSIPTAKPPLDRSRARHGIVPGAHSDDPRRWPTQANNHTRHRATDGDLTYAQIASRLGISGDAARILVRRRGWQRIPPNHPRGLTVVVVPDDAIDAEDWRHVVPTTGDDPATTGDTEARQAEQRATERRSGGPTKPINAPMRRWDSQIMPSPRPPPPWPGRIAPRLMPVICAPRQGALQTQVRAVQAAAERTATSRRCPPYGRPSGACLGVVSGAVGHETGQKPAEIAIP